MSPVAVLPNDPALPQLARVLDASAMASVFAEAIGRHGVAVEHCVVDRVKYRPRRNCTLSYRLHLRDTTTDQRFEQVVAARVCSDGESAVRFAKAAYAPLQPSLAGPSLHHLPDLDMVTWWWPNDPKLDAPSVLSHDERLRREVLPALVHALSQGQGTLVDHEVVLAQYVPEHRLCARVDLRWREGAELVDRSVYAKASRDPDGLTVHRQLSALQASTASREGRLHTPRALMWQAEAGLHWQEAVPGRPLLQQPESMARWAGPLGAQLAALHGTSMPTALPLTVGEQRERLSDVMAVLQQVLPDSRHDLQRLNGRLKTGLYGFAQEQLSTLHGDLHPNNVLVSGDRLTLIDLDDLRRGPASLELGSWRAEGMYRALLEGESPRRDDALWQAMLEGYAAAGGVVPSTSALAWATAWNLVTQRVWRCVINLKPGRFAIAPRLIGLAAEIADLPRRELA
ncbi:phosphotransferase [Ideonella sp. A 288]|uniref:phosphotransferase n=1 Tax=Ideonella sp. A 288 TaxID=1962181 RepID=UPI000B4BC4D0|nr:phosphotransferase [Ideonella sp. A 288]